MQDREILELLDRALRMIEDDTPVEDDGLLIVNLSELMGDLGSPDELLREFLPEPNCNDPSCAGCMMLRRLRGETLESNPGRVDTTGRVRPTDGPPIII